MVGNPNNSKVSGAIKPKGLNRIKLDTVTYVRRTLVFC
jgi:hypothetical protein